MRGSFASTHNKILRDFAYCIILSVALNCASWLISRYPLAEDVRQGTYDWLQSRLVASSKLPIAVIDISNLKPEPVPGRNGLEATPREQLITLIKALVPQRPDVIGIDIDFSPELDRRGKPAEYITPSDPVFFQFCVRQNKKVSIYLGVHRRQTLPPEKQLVLREFQKLAASLLKPNDPSRAIEWLNSAAGPPGTPTMASALAEAYKSKSPKGWPGKLRFLFEAVSQRKLSANPPVVVGEFLVDFSPLEELQRSRTIWLKSEDFEQPQYLTQTLAQRRDILNRSMLLVGDATGGEADDRFVVPGRDAPVPGVDVIACAAYTLASAPLYEFRQPWRTFLDAIIAIAIVFIVSVVRWQSTDKEFSEEAARRLTNWLIAGVVILLFVVGGLLVAWTHIVWDDLLIVSLVLILHPSVEKWVSQVLRRLESSKLRATSHRPAHRNRE